MRLTTAILTYVQSGNVIFSSEERVKPTVRKVLQEGLKKIFGLDLEILVFTKKEMKTVAEEAPPGYGTDEACKYDVLFFQDGREPWSVFKEIKAREGVDCLCELLEMGSHDRVKDTTGGRRP